MAHGDYSHFTVFQVSPKVKTEIFGKFLIAVKCEVAYGSNFLKGQDKLLSAIMHLFPEPIFKCNSSATQGLNAVNRCFTEKTKMHAHKHIHT